MRFKNAEAILSGGVGGAVNDTVACDDRLVYRNLGGGEDYGQEDPVLCFSTCRKEFHEVCSSGSILVRLCICLPDKDLIQSFTGWFLSRPVSPGTCLTSGWTCSPVCKSCGWEEGRECGGCS